MNTILNCVSQSRVCDSTLSTRMARHKTHIVRRFEYITQKTKRNLIINIVSVILFVTTAITAAASSALILSKSGNNDLPALTITLRPKTKRSENQPQHKPGSLPVKSAGVMSPDSSSKTNTVTSELPSAVTPDARASSPVEDATQTTSKAESDFSYDSSADILDTPSAESQQLITNNEPTLIQNSVEKPHKTPSQNIDASVHDSAQMPAGSESKQNTDNAVDIQNRDDSASPAVNETDTPDNNDTTQDENHSPYPGDMVGYVLLEDWSYDKMIADLGSASCLNKSSDNVLTGDNYLCGELSYDSGNAAHLRNISSSENGRIDVYIDSDYEQLIEIIFELDGKQISACSIVPDGETLYCFGGFDFKKTYDIIIKSSTGSTWKTTAQYVVC